MGGDEAGGGWWKVNKTTGIVLEKGNICGRNV